MTQYQLNLLNKYNLDPKDPYDDYYTPQNFQSIINIIQLWKLGRKGRGQKGGRTAIVKMNVSDLIRFKQFQRTETNNNYQVPEQGWDSLKQDILKNGIKQPLIIQIGKDGKSKITQGNHRLGICQQLKINQVPVVFQFVSNVYNGKVATLINNNMKQSSSWYKIIKLAETSLYQQIKDYPKVKYLKGIGAIDLDPNLSQVRQIVNDRRYGNSALQQSQFDTMIENIQNSYKELGNPQFFPRLQMPITNKIQYQKMLPKILQYRKKSLQPKVQPKPVQVKPDIEVRNTFNSKPTPKPMPFGTKLNIPKI